MSQYSKEKSLARNGAYYLECDVCGHKVRYEDTVEGKDRRTRQYGYIFCKRHLDKINEQTYLDEYRPAPERTPKKTRPEKPTRYVFANDLDEIKAAAEITNPTGRTPDAPTRLRVNENLGTSLVLQWDGPADQGGTYITGYLIERESPVGGGFSTIIDNTNNTACYYKDESVTYGTQYNYRVSAVGSFATSSASAAYAVYTISE